MKRSRSRLPTAILLFLTAAVPCFAQLDALNPFVQDVEVHGQVHLTTRPGPSSGGLQQLDRHGTVRAWNDGELVSILWLDSDGSGEFVEYDCMHRSGAQFEAAPFRYLVKPGSHTLLNMRGNNNNVTGDALEGTMPLAVLWRLGYYVMNRPSTSVQAGESEATVSTGGNVLYKIRPPGGPISVLEELVDGRLWSQTTMQGSHDGFEGMPARIEFQNFDPADGRVLVRTDFAIQSAVPLSADWRSRRESMIIGFVEVPRYHAYDKANSRAISFMDLKARQDARRSQGGPSEVGPKAAGSVASMVRRPSTWVLASLGLAAATIALVARRRPTRRR